MSQGMVAHQGLSHGILQNHSKIGDRFMNLDNRRLKEIQSFKLFYKQRISEAESELEHDLLEIQLNKLNEEEEDILKRCKAI